MLYLKKLVKNEFEKSFNFRVLLYRKGINAMSRNCLSNVEIEETLSDEKEDAEEVRYRLQEIIECECDDNNISLSVESIGGLLQKVPDRKLAPLNKRLTSTDIKNLILIDNFACNLLKEWGYNLKKGDCNE